MAIKQIVIIHAECINGIALLFRCVGFRRQTLLQTAQKLLQTAMAPYSDAGVRISFFCLRFYQMN